MFACLNYGLLESLPLGWVEKKFDLQSTDLAISVFVCEDIAQHCLSETVLESRKYLPIRDKSHLVPSQYLAVRDGTVHQQ